MTFSSVVSLCLLVRGGLCQDRTKSAYLPNSRVCGKPWFGQQRQGRGLWPSSCRSTSSTAAFMEAHVTALLLPVPVVLLAVPSASGTPVLDTRWCERICCCVLPCSTTGVGGDMAVREAVLAEYIGTAVAHNDWWDAIALLYLSLAVELRVTWRT